MRPDPIIPISITSPPSAGPGQGQGTKGKGFGIARPARPRDLLLELLWPEADLDAGRHNLSNALSVLRRVLEPAGVAPGTVILADHSAVRLNPDAVQTDVAAFEAVVEAAADPVLPEPE